MKIYHVETQEDYDDLMIKLENEGCMWTSEILPTSEKIWNTFKGNTYIALNENSKRLTYGYMGRVYSNYPDIPIIKYKAKGVENMEKVVVPQFVADWYEEYTAESLYSTLSYFLNGVGSTEELEKWGETCEGESAYPKVNAEKKIAKMHLYGYEVEEEKKYYWRKKKEYLFDFEYRHSSYYINLDTDDSTVFLDDKEETDPYPYRTKFTEIEIRKLVSKEDFSKLERVEIDDVQ